MNIRRIVTLTAVAFAAAMSAGCVNDDLHIENRNETGAEKGYLSLAGLQVDCVIDHKQSHEGIDPQSRATRADAEPNIDTFDCSILDATGTQVIKSFKYGERPTENIELEKGNYLFRMQSGEVQGAAWEAPVYGTTEPFTIVGKEVTSLENLVCRLLNIRISVSYSADLRAALSDDTTSTVKIDNNSLVYALTETRSGYFLAPKATNDVKVTVQGTYTAEGKEPSKFEMNATIKGVKAGQYRDITLVIEYSTEGNIVIKATIDGWVEDKEITCDFSTLIAEEIIDDDEKRPAIVWQDNDIDTPVTLSADKFDERGNCLVNFYIDVIAERTIAALNVDIASTNGDFISSLGDYNIPTSFDMCNAGTASASLKIMGYAVNSDVTGKDKVSYDLTAQMKQIKDYAGTHSFKITAKDAKGGTTEKTLTIVIPGAQTGPSIVWTGYNIEQRYEIADGMNVDIVVTAAAGVKAFTVQIVSDTLTPSELASAGLCDNLDLVNPEKSTDSTGSMTDMSEIETSLNNLGFPTRDKVLNQTTVSFSITNFLPMLSFTGTGEHNFIMTVTDNNGDTTVKTLMLKKSN